MTGILRHLLVATDGSATAKRAISFASAFARRHGSELLLCTVVDHAVAIAESSTANGGFGIAVPIVQDLDDNARAILAEALKSVTDAGVAATTELLDGRSAQAIVKLARERNVDAIVIGTQGKRGLERFFMGSTADSVLRHTDVPTFVIPPGVGEAEPTFERMLVAIDDSDPSDAAVAFAHEYAKAESAQLVFCAVMETRDLYEASATYGYDPAPMRDELHATASALVAAHADRANPHEHPIESVIAEGDPAEQILATAASRHVGSIIVGTHGRRGLRRFFVGSVAESVVRRSTVPVVVVRAPRHLIESERETALATSARCYT